MSKYEIVVGAGYGDEGKGKTVALLLSQYRQTLSKTQAAESRSLVVRFNSGPQAGHSVTYNGKTHIYSNYGAGTFINEFKADTYWSEFCTFNPLSIQKEFIQAQETFGTVSTRLYIDPEAMLITPYDTFANNSTLLTYDNLQSHSSCGSGHGSTVARNETPYKLTAFEYFSAPESILREKLHSIKGYYSKLFRKDSNLWTQWIHHQARIDELVRDLIQARKQKDEYHYGMGSRILYNSDHIVFEGAQGTLIDQHYGTFPNVTRSNTTVRNALNLIAKYCPSRSLPTLYLVTRCYHTRHGRGSIPNIEPITLTNTETEINRFNEHQGPFKVSVFQSDLFHYAMQINQSEINNSNKFTTYVSDTCMDTVIICNNLDQISELEQNMVLEYLRWKYKHYRILTTNEVDINKKSWDVLNDPRN